MNIQKRQFKSYSLIRKGKRDENLCWILAKGKSLCVRLLSGSDALSLINTLRGMAIDIDTRRPKLANITGGLSGPAIKPIALRMVWEASQSVKIPVIGIGGIINAQDAIEFMIAALHQYRLEPVIS